MMNLMSILRRNALQILNRQSGRDREREEIVVLSQRLDNPNPTIQNQGTNIGGRNRACSTYLALWAVCI